MKYRLLKGDCLKVLKQLSQEGIKVDAIITDPPYGTTQCKWDSVIDIKLMWKRLLCVAKPNTAILLFGTEPFSSCVRVNNIRMFKYDWVWQKDKATNHLNCKKQPMRRNEIISVFYNKQCQYNPQLKEKDKCNIRPPTTFRNNISNYGSMNKKSERSIPINKSYPNETLYFRGCFGDKGKSNHPTEKPVELLKYLILTYTKKGDTVLDFTMGSGSTGVACKCLKRNFIGIEINKTFYQLAKNRIFKNN